LLVRGRLRRFPDKAFEALPGPAVPAARCLRRLLRQAVVLHRGRTGVRVPLLDLRADEQRIQVRFPDGWLDGHPLTGADLSGEREHLAAVEIRLDVD